MRAEESSDDDSTMLDREESKDDPTVLERDGRRDPVTKSEVAKSRVEVIVVTMIWLRELSCDGAGVGVRRTKSEEGADISERKGVSEAVAAGTRRLATVDVLLLVAGTD